jgi:hypothetical protein
VNHPTYVVHDEKRWRVLGSDTERVSNEPMYRLARPGFNGGALYAFVADCKPWVAGPRRRTWRYDGCVLESDGRTMTIRKARERKRWPTSLTAIYSMTVKAHLANEHAKKQRAKGRR